MYSFGMFSQYLIEKLHWLSVNVFLEIFALCQCMPGPASTQVSFALGILKKGVLGRVHIATTISFSTSLSFDGGIV